MSTPIGATYRACDGTTDSASAVARAFIEPIPKSLAKKLVAGLRAVTSIVSPAEYVPVKVMSPPTTPPPFRFA